MLGADGTHFDHNWHDFDIVEKAVLTVLDAKPDSPVGVLAQGKKRLTAFIPTDAAFRRLVDQLTGKTPHTEKATFEAVASVADVDTLETILLYHVVPGATITSRQAAKADGAKLKTAEGKTIRVNVKGNGAIRLQDQDKNARNARVIPRLDRHQQGQPADRPWHHAGAPAGRPLTHRRRPARRVRPVGPCCRSAARR